MIAGLFAAILGPGLPNVFAGESLKIVPGNITSVTVYPGIANVERTAALSPGEPGKRSLSLGPLPADLRDRSVKVATSSGIEVLSVQVQRSSGDPVESKRVAELRVNVEEAKQALQALTRQEETLEALQQRYEGMVPGKPGPETKWALSLQAWQGMVDLILKGIDVTTQQRMELVPQVREAEDRFEKFKMELEQLTAGSERSQATIELEVFDAEGVGGVFRVQYQIPGATWYPSYEMEVDTERKVLHRRSYAEVRQWTGEDWPAVPMFFATSLPESGAEPDKLVALKIERPRYLPQEPVPNPRSSPRPESSRALDRGIPAKLESPKLARKRLQPEVVGGLLLDEKRISFFATEDKRIPQMDDRGFLAVFEAIHAAPVPSDGTIQRRLHRLNQSPYIPDHICLPELEDAVFRRLKMPLEGEDPLLAGSASVFAGDDYLGLTHINRTIAPGEDLKIDLGILDQVVVTRTTEDSEETRGLLSRSLQYRTDTRLRFENFGNRTESFEVQERIPVSDEESVSISVDRGSTDPDPEGMNSSDGILRWKISVEPGQSKEIRLVWTMQIPKEKVLKRREAPERKGEE